MNRQKLIIEFSPLVFMLILTICLILFISTYSTSFAQEPPFRREIDTIPVFINDVPVQSPFAGGITLSKPTFVDIDNDGDFDLFVGELVEGDGKINFYRNTGTATNHTLTFETDNFASINLAIFSTPTFADIDNDGDLDLFIGENYGTIHFYRNKGTASKPIFTLEMDRFASIDVGERSTPTFADIDNDGDLDLFVGERDGNINFYRNTGTVTNPTFTFETDSFASINVGIYSTPTFADIDNDGGLDLFVGEHDGNINFYRNAGTATSPIFVLETENFASNDVGNSSAPAFADIDNDGDLDFFVGQGGGNINFYRNIGTAIDPTFKLVTENLAAIDVGFDSAPTLADIDNDGNLDLFLVASGLINFRNAGTVTNPIFKFETDNFLIILAQGRAPSFADIDNDGDLDLFVGVGGSFGGGNIRFFRNTGTATNPIFVLETENFASIAVGSSSTPTFADIDNDSDLDLFVGESDGNVNFYRNAGTATNPIFVLETENFASIDVGSSSTPAFADIDNDGDLDFFLGEDGGNINFYRNIGTVTNPAFSRVTENFFSIDVGLDSHPTFADIDNDGDFDLFVGESDGGLYFYRNLAPRPPLTISGFIRDSQKLGISGVQINFSNEGGMTITDALGFYSIELPNSWSGTATPLKNLYDFVPLSRSYSNLTASLSNQDYVGYGPTDSSAPPTNLRVDSVGTDSVLLKWSDNSSYEDGYIVKRSLPRDTTTFIEVAKMPPNTNKFYVLPLQPSTYYIFRVTAFDESTGESVPAEIRTRTSAIISSQSGRPTDLVAMPRSANSILLTWKDNSAREDGFLIERFKVHDSLLKDLEVAQQKNSRYYLDTGVLPGTPYAYEVRSKELSRFSDPSDLAVATTYSITSIAQHTKGLIVDNQGGGAYGWSYFNILGFNQLRDGHLQIWTGGNVVYDGDDGDFTSNTAIKLYDPSNGPADEHTAAASNPVNPVIIRCKEEKIEVHQFTYQKDDKNWILIEWTVRNTGAETKQVKLAFYLDVDTGGELSVRDFGSFDKARNLVYLFNERNYYVPELNKFINSHVAYIPQVRDRHFWIFQTFSVQKSNDLKIHKLQIRHKLSKELPLS